MQWYIHKRQSHLSPQFGIYLVRFLISKTTLPDPPSSIRSISLTGFSLWCTGTYVKCEKHIQWNFSLTFLAVFASILLIFLCRRALICLCTVDLRVSTDPHYKHNLSVVSFFASHLPPFLGLAHPIPAPPSLSCSPSYEHTSSHTPILITAILIVQEVEAIAFF